MQNYYRRASFLISAAQSSQFPPENGMEVAFAGRSNAGKSSALNTLCENKNLARTSKTPGRTQLINFFALDELRLLVDLPGYGYAKVPEQMRRDWQALMENYLTHRQSLCGLVIIMDVRQALKDYDLQMLDWCRHYGIPSHILLTKADKLSRNQANQALFKVQRTLKDRGFIASTQLFSALDKTGVETLREKLNDWYGLEPDTV